MMRFFRDSVMSKLELNPTDQPRFIIADLSEPVAKELKQIWVKASIATVNHRTIVSKLAQAYECGKQCERRPCPYEGGEKLFDICVCTCPRVECSVVGTASLSNNQSINQSINKSLNQLDCELL